ncbi:MAG: guanylate kinase [bacterium]|nr:guanylate kinase [bacterium]
MSNKGTKAIIFSSPSGGGKNTVIKKLMEIYPNFRHSISVTTRDPRHNTEGRDYRFVTDEEFERMIRNQELAEWAEVHGSKYGTPLLPLRELQQNGYDILFDLDVCGTLSMKSKWNNILTIFLLPPSKEILIERLLKRGTETYEEIQRRLLRYEFEVEQSKYYDINIINQNLDETIRNVDDNIQKWDKYVLF